MVMLVLHPKNSHSGRAGPVTSKLSRETLSSEKLYPGGSVLLVRSGRSGLWSMSDPMTGAKLDGGRGWDIKHVIILGPRAQDPPPKLEDSLN